MTTWWDKVARTTKETQGKAATEITKTKETNANIG